MRVDTEVDGRFDRVSIRNELEARTSVLDARAVVHRFGDNLVLDGISLQVAAGEIHALLGPNGAGKTTLIRIFAGLLHATEGSIEVAGFSPASNPRLFRQHIGFLPSGDRTFYLRISGLENLVFFARLYGMRRRRAIARALAVISAVGLEDAATVPVALYSHGMQKRLAMARALLTSPPVLLIDEATHDLDPEGAQRVRDLVALAAEQGSAVVWATQRLDEIRGFADLVTLLDRGDVRFVGTVPQLTAYATPSRFVLHVWNGSSTVPSQRTLDAALDGLATLDPVGEEESEHYSLSLADGVVLGDALAALAAVDMKVVSCRQERSEIEEAFLRLTKADGQ
jgi:ABC-2 type transport system ATP-binding protein